MAGLITILAALVPFVIWLWQRHDAAKDDPRNKLSAAKDENSKTVALGSAADVNALLTDRLDRVRPQNPNPGSGSSGG